MEEIDAAMNLSSFLESSWCKIKVHTNGLSIKRERGKIKFLSLMTPKIYQKVSWAKSQKWVSFLTMIVRTGLY